MAQRMIDIYNLKKKLKNVSTQTGLDELFFNLTKTKHARIYYSKCYKSNVISLNINKSKAFIITPHIWKILKSKSNLIDSIFENDS